MDLEDKKIYADKWFSYLQEQICMSFEKIEICEPSSVNNIPMNLKSSAHYSLLKQTA